MNTTKQAIAETLYTTEGQVRCNGCRSTWALEVLETEQLDNHSCVTRRIARMIQPTEPGSDEEMKYLMSLL